MKRVRILHLTILILTAAIAVWAEAISCTACNKRIEGRYVIMAGNSFCSRKCLETVLPKCTMCKRPIEGKYTSSGENKFCSQSCFDRFLPKCELCSKAVQSAVLLDKHVYCEACASLPACFTCRLPVKKGVKLQDERLICTVCADDAVFDRKKGEPLYRQAQQDLQLVTRMISASTPPWQLVSLKQMRELFDNPSVRENTLVQRGLYKRNETVTTRKNLFGMTLKEDREISERIYLLYGMPQDVFISTASHELMHDLLAERYPELSMAPLWVEEGICQYAAALVCRHNGFDDVLESIETCEDVNYGDGYRFFRRMAGERNWPRIIRWLSRTDLGGLPAQPPRER